VLIDCDANATYSPDSVGKELIRQALEVLGNPSSLHRGGQRAKVALEEARDSIRALVGLPTNSSRFKVIFTSGASEANNLVVASFARGDAHVVSSKVEHACVLMPLERASAHGAHVALVDPSRDGVVGVDQVLGAAQPHTALVSVMAANNEIGAINPIAEVAKAVRVKSPRAVIHTDAAQVLGKISWSMEESGVDCATLSGHKFGSLPGVGALIAREGVALSPIILGGSQEEKLRGGTENVLGIVHMGLVARRVLSELQGRTQRMAAVRDAFEARLREKVPQCSINALNSARLPNTSSVSLPGMVGDDLVVALDLLGILVSSGAACSSGKPEPSHVLLAMGQERQQVKATVRVSFRADQEPELGVQVADALAEVVARSGGTQ
jgi:cysteine desulfurase